MPENVTYSRVAQCSNENCSFYGRCWAENRPGRTCLSVPASELFKDEVPGNGRLTYVQRIDSKGAETLVTRYEPKPRRAPTTAELAERRALVGRVSVANAAVVAVAQAWRRVQDAAEATEREDLIALLLTPPPCAWRAERRPTGTDFMTSGLATGLLELLPAGVIGDEL